SHADVVFDDQDCFVATGQFRAFAVWSRRWCENLREINVHGGAFSELAFDNDVSTALANNSIACSQAEPAAVAILFGGKERFEQMFLCVVCHPHAIVDHANAPVFPA